MNYTENYHLPQWEENDRVLRKDFNQMCADVDEGLAAAAVVPFVVGSYMGNGAAQDIYLGFRPSFLIIAANQAGASASDMGRFSGFSESQNSRDKVTFTDTGFHLASISTTLYPRVNDGFETYAYIAFR